MCKKACHCGCESVSDIRLKYQKQTGNTYDREQHFFKTEEKDPYIEFLENELLKIQKKEKDDLKKIIENEL